MNTSVLITQISTLDVEVKSRRNVENILFYSLELTPTSRQFLLELKQIRDRTDSFKLNGEFHSTILFTGGKENPNIETLTPLVGEEYFLVIDRVAISDRFITFGVDSIFDDESEIPYFGNEIKHITVGIAKKPSKKGGMAPINSPSAFVDGEVIIFMRPFVVTGYLKEITKK